MSAKEQAIALVEKYKEPTEEWVDDDDGSGKFGWFPNLDNAKACAIIAVDEIMMAIEEMEDSTTFIEDSAITFWQEVKQQIELI